MSKRGRDWEGMERGRKRGRERMEGVVVRREWSSGRNGREGRKKDGGKGKRQRNGKRGVTE